MDERIGTTPPPIAPAAARRSRQLITHIARRAVPALADFAMVFVVAGRSLVGIASVHGRPDGDRVLRALLRIYRIPLADLRSTAAQVIRTCRPAIRNGIQLERNPVARGSVADLHRRLGTRSVLVLPIVRNNMVFGALSLCYAESGRRYSRGDVPAARRLTRRLAIAVAPGFADAASRLRSATGDARDKSTVRRRMAARN